MKIILIYPPICGIQKRQAVDGNGSLIFDKEIL